MRNLGNGLGLGMLLALGGASGAGAVDVTFSGTLSGVCTLAVPTPGVLALAPDGSLGSELGSGVPAVLTILSVGSNTVSIDPPSWVSTPVGYDNTGEDLEVSYLGVGGLSLIDQDYTGAASNFTVGTLPLTALTINARASNENGFDAGTYQMKVVVTCS